MLVAMNSKIAESVCLKNKRKYGILHIIAEESCKQSSSEDEEEIINHVQKKKRKLNRKRQEEKESAKIEAGVREAELSLLRPPTAPITEQDYKKLLLNNPTCSATWIQYISFLLSIDAKERACSVARRALKVIPCEEQQERLNIWTVLLRLEVQYFPKVVEKTAQEAVAHCDPYTILCNLADIYEESGLFNDAEVVYKKLTKKFYAELEAWVRFGQFYYKHKRLDQAREVLNKANLVLQKKTGLDVTNRFAQMEMNFGDQTKACHMFESLVGNFPKRLDIWNVYVDLLVKHGDIVRARQTLMRMLSLSLRSKQVANILRKFRDFEAKHGDKKTQQEARKLMEECLSRMASELPTDNE